MNIKRIIIRSEAESDIKDAYEWYEAQRKGLGENFLLCIEEALSRASRHPAMYSIVYKGVHRVLIHRFPFGVFFIEGKESISVLAVLHARRNPKEWKNRT
ncbi:MAG: type II toxin-antitoxin system RelE/ParE family toxin [Candidatus Polarisedimenticolaceae bacterium]|nr:type II toxin-antitoxin system RelE/ParE family toxin [Candidatus Polarisedimenticolaceae bacterium]